MKIYKTEEDVKKDIVNKRLTILNDSVKFEDNICIDASIIVPDGDIEGLNIDARNILSKNLTVQCINVWDIKCKDIIATDIISWDIKAENINARDIFSKSIEARDIKYYAFCITYYDLICNSAIATRSVATKPFSLEGGVKMLKPEQKFINIENICLYQH